MMNSSLLIGFIFGGVAATAAAYIFLKYFFRKKKHLPSFFGLNDYNSQQLSKLLGARVIEELKANKGLRSIDPEKLPLAFQSQWCEDLILNEYFNHKKDGYYVEIGAFDGVRLSNTYFFECIGWKGLLVEPQPDQFAKCLQNRPNSQCENVAISENPGEVELNVVENDHMATWSFIGEDQGNIQNYDLQVKKIKVPTARIDDLLPGNVAKIDFISIDVEGMELEILKTIDLNKHSPAVILLENSSEPIQQYLRKFGYHLAAKTWINFFYCKDAQSFKNISIWEPTGIKILG